jgi:hypothetical protein
MEKRREATGRMVNGVAQIAGSVACAVLVLSVSQCVLVVMPLGVMGGRGDPVNVRSTPVSKQGRKPAALHSYRGHEFDP